MVLYGAKCDINIWASIKDGLSEFDLEYIEYPHEILEKAFSVDNIAAWVANVYGARHYDVLIGHSMGGQVILKMLAHVKEQPTKIVLLESNPLPSGSFYRNLMTEEHQKKFGKLIMDMFQKESPFYSQPLLDSLRDDFDLLPCIREYKGQLFAIYGDRGLTVNTRHYEELFLPKDIAERMKIYFVPNACHLPMIENPPELARILSAILTEEK